jgi:hypothetical protein
LFIGAAIELLISHFSPHGWTTVASSESFEASRLGIYSGRGIEIQQFRCQLLSVAAYAICIGSSREILSQPATNATNLTFAFPSAGGIAAKTSRGLLGIDAAVQLAWDVALNVSQASPSLGTSFAAPGRPPIGIATHFFLVFLNGMFGNK